MNGRSQHYYHLYVPTEAQSSLLSLRATLIEVCALYCSGVRYCARAKEVFSKLEVTPHVIELDQRGQSCPPPSAGKVIRCSSEILIFGPLS